MEDQTNQYPLGITGSSTRATSSNNSGKPNILIRKNHPELTAPPLHYKEGACSYCSEPVYMYKYGPRLYCGDGCRKKAYKRRKLGAIPEKLNCLMCNTLIIPKPKVARSQKFCSTRCRHKWHWRLGASKPVPVFLNSRTIIYTTKYDQIEEIKHLYENREKIRLDRRPNGQGETLEPRKPSYYEPGLVLPRFSPFNQSSQ